MLVVGLTGGIASGKSTVSKLLTETHQTPLIDLDILARQVVQPGQPALKALKDHFGSEIILKDGTLDRPTLGRIVFGNEQQRKVLNSITHSAIRKRMAWLICKYWLGGAKVVVVDTPLLVETGMWKWCGEMVLVWCSREDQLSRMLKRDGPSGLTESDAKSRLDSQQELSSKKPYADVILDNSSALDHSTSSSSSEALKAQVSDLVRRWESESQGLGWLKYVAEWIVPPFGLIMGLITIMKRRKAVQGRISKL